MKIHSILTVMLTGIAAVLLSTTAFAQAQHTVGRTTLSLPSANWKELKLDDAGMQYGGELSGKLAAETKIFIQNNVNGNIDAILWVRASASAISGGFFTYTPSCENKDAVLSEGNKGYQQSSSQCLFVFPLFTSSSLVKSLGENSVAALKQHQEKMPKTMKMISAYYAGSTGTFIQVNAIFSPDFAGVVENAPGTDPHLAWGRLLMRQARNSVTSLFGSWELPAVVYRPKTTESEKRLGLLVTPLNIQ